jgi:hypothetical protein
MNSERRQKFARGIWWAVAIWYVFAVVLTLQGPAITPVLTMPVCAIAYLLTWRRLSPARGAVAALLPALLLVGVGGAVAAFLSPRGTLSNFLWPVSMLLPPALVVLALGRLKTQRNP